MNSKKYNIQIAKLLLMSLLVISKAIAQQAPQFTQNKENRYILNPAATGVNEYWTGGVGFRKQWVGFGEEPTTFYIGANSGFVRTTQKEYQPLALRTNKPESYSFEQSEGGISKLKHGIGAYIMSDNYGKFKKTSFNINYAIHTALTDKINVSLGASAGFNNLAFNDNIILETQNDKTYARFISENGSRSMIDINLGAYLYNDDFFFGYATNQLTGDKISLGGGVSILELHHNLMGGYIYKVNNELKLIPSLFLKAVGGAPLSVDLNLRADYNEFFGGITYRNDDAIALMIGATVNEMFKLSYSYDFNTSSIGIYSSGGHEIVLGFIIKK